MARVNFSKYATDITEVSILKGVPIAYLAQYQRQLREHNALKLALGGEALKLRFRFRGPRRTNKAGRCSYSGQLTCLKADAVTFSVYWR